MGGLNALKPWHNPRQGATDRAAIQRTSQEVFNIIAIAGIAAPASIPWVCAMIVVVGSVLTAGLRLAGRHRHPVADPEKPHASAAQDHAAITADSAAVKRTDTTIK
jgi:hypothetical protein